MSGAAVTGVATAAFGLEALVLEELRALDLAQDARIENGRVVFFTDLRGIARANLWLRVADRVFIELTRFEATSFDMLYEGAYRVPWPDWLGRKAKFPVRGKTVHSALFSLPDCQAIVKKAVVNKLRDAYHTDWFEETGPEYAIELSLVKDIATLSLDTSGPGLHRRGYRLRNAEAPLRETLAAAVVHLARFRGDRPCIDPMCGSGTLPIEAAMKALNIPPGHHRAFACETWPQIGPHLFAQLREQANGGIVSVSKPIITGSDIDGKVLESARYHARLAGVEGAIHFQKQAMERLASSKRYGLILCNPPYGERLGDKKHAEELYQHMGKTFLPLREQDWSLFVLTAHDGFERFFGRRCDKKRRLYNGKLVCNLYQYFGKFPPKRVNREYPTPPDSTEQP